MKRKVITDETVKIESLKVMQTNTNEQLNRVATQLKDIDRKIEGIIIRLNDHASKNELKQKADRESVDNLWKFTSIIVVLLIFLLGFISSLLLKNGGVII